MLTASQEDLWGEVECLSRLCDRRLPETDPVRQLLHNAVFVADNTYPCPAALHSARQAFYAMPVEKLSKVLAGWSVQERRQSRSHLLACVESQNIHRVLSIEATGDSSLRPGRVSACHDFEFESGFSPVRVVIAEGATSGEVLSALGRIRDLIDREWESLIRDTASGLDLEAADAAADAAEVAADAAENEGMIRRREFAAA
jgi:hypothetical protein